MTCEKCGKEHDGSYGSGRFCCKECARSFSTKKENKNELKEAKCIDCGKTIYINKRASNKTCRCNDCYEKYLLNSSLTRTLICPICGSKYIKGNCCKNIFCTQHNIQGFKLLIEYFGFNKEKLGTLEVENEYNRIRNIIYDLYWKENLSAKEISDKFNFKSKHSITQTIFKFLNIPKRDFCKCISNAYFTKRLSPHIKNQYKSEYHKTWNGKEVFLRSSYETDYANELDKKCIDYEVETLRIVYLDTSCNQERIAIPDFYLPETNTIVEIKSSFTLNIEEMKDKVKAYKDLGYNFKLVLNHNETDLYSLSEERIHPNTEYSIYRVLGSAYGTCWVYNDKESKKIKKEHLNEYLSNGWIKGRKMKF